MRGPSFGFERAKKWIDNHGLSTTLRDGALFYDDVDREAQDGDPFALELIRTMQAEAGRERLRRAVNSGTIPVYTSAGIKDVSKMASSRKRTANGYYYQRSLFELKTVAEYRDYVQQRLKENLRDADEINRHLYVRELLEEFDAEMRVWEALAQTGHTWADLMTGRDSGDDAAEAQA